MKNQIISNYPFSGMIPYSPVPHCPMSEIVETICREYNLRPVEVIGESRGGIVVECRFLCMRILYEKNFSPKAIGELLGVGRRAVYWGIDRIKDWADITPVLKQRIAFIESIV